MGKILIMHQGHAHFIEEEAFEERAFLYLERKGSMSKAEFVEVLQRVLHLLEHRRIEEFLHRWFRRGEVAIWVTNEGEERVERAEPFIRETCEVFGGFVDRVFAWDEGKERALQQRLQHSVRAPSAERRVRSRKPLADGKMFEEENR